MPRVFVILLLVSLAVGGSTAVAAAGARIGLKGGWNKADVRLSEEELTGSRNGLALGAYMSIPVARWFSVQPEILFMMKGDEQRYDGVLFPIASFDVFLDGSVRVERNDLEIPVLAVFHLRPEGRIRPSLFAGPAIGLNLRDTFIIDGMIEGRPGTIDSDIENTESADFGVVLGGGLGFPLSSRGHGLGVEVRYAWGLTNTYDAPDDLSSKNRVLSVLMSLEIPLPSPVRSL